MAFAAPDLATIRARILHDMVNLNPRIDVNKDSDNYIRASAFAAAVEGLYQHQAWAARQILADTQDSDFLEREARLYGIAREPAVAATGSINFAGVASSEIPLGTEAKSTSGLAFVTTAPGVIGSGGTATVAAAAAVAGMAGNLEADTPLTLSTAPAGVDGGAAINTMTGGVDVESDAGLLARLLYRIQHPPHGGADFDYVRWAKEVAGVTAAYVYPLRRGAGTVDVAILTEGGLPAAPLIASVQAHINALRPVTADCMVMAPTAVVTAVTATLTLIGTTLAAAAVAIEAALTAYFSGLAPGDTAVRNRLIALLQDISGVVDVDLTAPAANVATLVDATHCEIATLGTVTLT